MHSSSFRDDESGGWLRTSALSVCSRVLYQLSYPGIEYFYSMADPLLSLSDLLSACSHKHQFSEPAVPASINSKITGHHPVRFRNQDVLQEYPNRKGRGIVFLCFYRSEAVLRLESLSPGAMRSKMSVSLPSQSTSSIRPVSACVTLAANPLLRSMTQRSVGPNCE